MFKSTTLFLALVLTSALVLAQNTTDEVSTHLSGFVSGTTFSDHEWYPSIYSAALNIDMTYEEWAIRGQLTEPNTEAIRRLVLERSFWLAKKQELVVQVGIIPRIDTLFNSVTDAPGTSGLAILPLSIYNRDVMNNRSFDSLEGIQSIYSLQTNKGLFKAHIDYGTMMVGNQCNTQEEITNSSCRTGYDVKGDSGNYDYGISYEYKQLTLLAYHGDTLASTMLLNKNDVISKTFTSTDNRIKYSTDTIGGRYELCNWLFQSEYSKTNYSLAKLNSNYSLVERSWKMYGLIDYHWTSFFSMYAEYNRGNSNTNNLNTDKVFGSTFTIDDTTISVEHHAGFGNAMEKLFPAKSNWSSWVLSVTQRF